MNWLGMFTILAAIFAVATISMALYSTDVPGHDKPRARRWVLGCFILTVIFAAIAGALTP